MLLLLFGYSFASATVETDAGTIVRMRAYARANDYVVTRVGSATGLFSSGGSTDLNHVHTTATALTSVETRA